MSAADKVLPLLDKVRKSGPSSWTARCPAHDDRGPSLSVKMADDGKLLMHCFAGCSVYEVVGVLGLTPADLFPARPEEPGGGSQRRRRPWTAVDLLRLAAFEASVAVVVTADMLAGRDADRARLIEAARRLGDMVEAVDAH